MSGAAVELRGIGKSYGSVQALKHAHVTLEPGKFLVLLGPSGSGKTTLIRCLAGIEKISAGEIAIGGQVVSGARVHVASDKRDLGMVFQDFALWPHMTVTQNVAFPLRRRRSLSKAQGAQRAQEMLEKVGLAGYGQRYPHELSGGQQQRVALARALVARPGLLLFDEPLSALDANLRERLRVEIGTLVRDHGATAVYITHDQGEAFALGDEIGVLQDGELVQLGTPEQIYRTPLTPFVARFTGITGALNGRLITVPESFPGVGTVQAPSTDPNRHLQFKVTVVNPLKAGDAVQVLLRPTAARVIRRGARAACLRTVVRDGAYHGRGYFYVLKIGEGLELTGVFDRRRFERGHHADIYIDPAGALAFAAEPGEMPLLAADTLCGDGVCVGGPGPSSTARVPLAPAFTTGSGDHR